MLLFGTEKLRNSITSERTRIKGSPPPVELASDPIANLIFFFQHGKLEIQYSEIELPDSTKWWRVDWATDLHLCSLHLPTCSPFSLSPPISWFEFVAQMVISAISLNQLMLLTS